MYRISLYASRGGKHRRHTNYKTPVVKKALKSASATAKAVVVVLASAEDGLRFTHQALWHAWADDTVGFAVYVEDAPALQLQCTRAEWTYWEPFLCPLQTSSAWGQFSLLQAELCALRWAYQRFTEAVWFHVVSGDSVPTKSPAAFVAGPSSQNSVLGFDSHLEHKKLKLFEHSQWKVLS